MGNTAAGWYPDPEGSGQLRWWTGDAWTGALLPPPAPAPQAQQKSRPGCGIFGCLGLIVAVVVVVVAISVGVGGLGSGVGSTTTSTAEEAAGRPAPKSAAQTQDEAQKAAGWSVIESGSLYGKFAAKDEYTCGYGKCSYYLVQTLNGCPTALYVEGSTLSGSTVVGMTNDLLSAVQAGETAAAHLQIIEDNADSVRISSVKCY